MSADIPAKICIFGVGAVSGLVAGRLAAAGHEPTLVSRGERLEALRTDGLTVRDRNGTATHHLPVTNDTTGLGPQDLVLLGTKAHAIGGAIDQIVPLVGPKTVIVPMINGIPFWYFHPEDTHGGGWLESVDPGGKIWSALDMERVLGCVVYIMNSMPEPGVVEVHNDLMRFYLGEFAGGTSHRSETVAALLEGIGIETPLVADIRREVWIKIWGNLTGNPLSVLAEATSATLAADAGCVEVMKTMMREAAEVAATIGVSLADDAEELEREMTDRIKGFAALGEIGTSMLQDYETGRALEIGPILGAVCELGQRAGIATPALDIIYALTCTKARAKGLA